MDRAILYIKPGCPWCIEATTFLKRHSVAFTSKDVLTDRVAMQRMRDISGQSKTPTLEVGDFVCADFDTGELMAALNRAPKVRSELGLDKAPGAR